MLLIKYQTRDYLRQPQEVRYDLEIAIKKGVEEKSLSRLQFLCLYKWMCGFSIQTISDSLQITNTIELLTAAFYYLEETLQYRDDPILLRKVEKITDQLRAKVKKVAEEEWDM